MNTIVALTGKEDVITDGKSTFVVSNGHPILTKVTGTGCLLTSVIGAFTAVEKDFLKAATAALIIYGVAAEVAADKSAMQGPGSFQVELLNQLYHLDAEEIYAKSSFNKRR